MHDRQVDAGADPFCSGSGANSDVVCKSGAEARIRVVEVDMLRTAAAAVVSEDLERLARRTHDEYVKFSSEYAITTADVRPGEIPGR